MFYIGKTSSDLNLLKAQAKRFDEKCIKPAKSGNDVAKAMRAKLK